VPIYEYECTTCGKRFEIKQKMSDPVIKSCEQFACEKAQPVYKVISPPAIMFKGSGWYVTDYSDKYKDGKPTNDGEKTETKSDGKTATKSETKPSTDSSSTSSSTSSPSTATSTASSGSANSGSSNTSSSSTST